VGLGFQQGAPGSGTLREGGREEGGKRVREEAVYFGGIQYWLRRRALCDDEFMLSRKIALVWEDRP